MFPPGAQIQHPNGLRITAFDAAGEVTEQPTFFSIGGGFVTEDVSADSNGAQAAADQRLATVPFPLHSAAELLATAQANELSISQLMLENECALVTRSAEKAPVELMRKGIDRLWLAMQDCVARGIAAEGILPGGQNVRRRAPTGCASR